MKLKIIFTLLLSFQVCINYSNAQWTDVSINAHYNLSNASFPGNNYGYVVSPGTSNLLYKTTNGGTSWDSLYLAFFPEDVDFVDPDNGYVLMHTISHHYIGKTTNGGNNWILDSLPGGIDFNLIQFTNINTGYVISTSDDIYKTTNSGGNWILVNPADYGTAYDKDRINADTIVFTGWDGTFGYQGTVKRSVDGGNSFQTNTIATSSSILKGSHFVNGNTGYAVFNQGWPNKNYLIHTTDAGNSWDTVFIDTTSNLNYEDVFAINANDIYIVASNDAQSNGYIFKINGGVKTLEHSVPLILKRFYMANNVLFAVGEGGNVFSLNMSLGLEDHAQFLTGIYPNPTSGMVNIHIELRSLVTILDLQGKTILEKYINPGDPLVLTEIADGMYCIRIKNENGISTGRFIMSK